MAMSPVTMQLNVAALTASLLATGHDHSLAIRPDGSLWEWGRAIRLSIDVADEWEFEAVPRRVGEYTWLNVVAGAVHTLAIRADGMI
ncbi:MAG: hypothetical protein FWF79_05920 [Defluviitaleaceae bacterium]|nr:hypothetical protein [Defluviitaleaceae bacterium]